MRRLAAALLTATVLLAGCGDGGTTDDTTEPDAGGADLATLQAVDVEGELGSEPTLSFDQPFEVAQPVAYVETEGEGDTLEEGQSVAMHYVAVSGEDGSTLGSTWEQGTPEQITLGDPQIVPALTETLTGQNVGSRIMFAAPGSPATDTSEATAATLMAIEVVEARTIPARAEGTPVEPVAGLPTVTLADDGAPTIEIPADAPEPESLVVQPLIEGTGPVVEAGQTLTVHYTGTLWDGTVFDSSWERGQPAQFGIGVGQVIQGWDQGLVGQPVGSQVLLVIPSELGYGEEGSGDIPGGATLVFVVDILDAS